MFYYWMISSQSSNYSSISTAVTTKSTKVGQLYIPISEYEHYNGSEWVPVENFSVEGTQINPWMHSIGKRQENS